MKYSTSIFREYSYGWITLGLFGFSLGGHWLFGWFAFVSEQSAHGQAINVSDYIVTMMRDTLENWQSEFLQLLWQVGGLAFFMYLGSPQSKEGEDRIEEKVEALLRRIEPAAAEQLIAEIDRKHGREA